MKTAKTLALTAALALASFGARADNLIVNGDFDAGLTGFTSSYAMGPGANVYDPGVLKVGSNPHDFHQSWGNFDSGNMLIVNGGVSLADNIVWSQTVSVSQGVQYLFSASATSLYAENPAVLQAVATVNGHDYLLGNAFALSGNVGQWQTWSGSVISPLSGNVTLKLLDLSAQYQGNDFAIDKLSLTAAVPEPQTYALMLAGLAAVAFTARRRQRQC